MFQNKTNKKPTNQTSVSSQAPVLPSGHASVTKEHAVGHLSQATVALEGKVSRGGSGIVEVGRDKFSQEIALSTFSMSSRP